MRETPDCRRGSHYPEGEREKASEDSIHEEGRQHCGCVTGEGVEGTRTRATSLPAIGGKHSTVTVNSDFSHLQTHSHEHVILPFPR